jgi:hypothetical protein
VQLQNIEFPKQLQQVDGKETFGTIEAEIRGYLLDYIEEAYVEEIIIEEPGDLIGIEEEAIIGGGEGRSGIKQPDILTGRKQFDDRWFKRYVADEYKRPDGSLYWGPWKFVEHLSVDWGETILMILSVIIGIFLLFSLIALFIASWKAGFILTFFLAAILILNYTAIKFSGLINGVFKVLGGILIAVIGFGIISSLISGFSIKRQKYTVKGEGKTERTENDSIITHVRSWNDYSNKSYKVGLSVRKRDVQESIQFHSVLQSNASSGEGIMKDVYQQLNNFDDSKLNLVYDSLNSIKTKYNLKSNKRFAEIIVSCVQGIPYVAIMDKSCNPNLYDNQSLKEMLMTCECKGFVPYGVQTPVEFLADLKGDCDTRTLLLFSLLKKFGYDVAIFNSDEYMHSVLGINLVENISEKYRVIKKGDYFLWETTAEGMPIGMLSPENENTNYWDLYIK